MSNGMVSAILLAAGESKRMGGAKLLLPFGSSTILEQTVDNLLNSRVDDVIVVLGHSAAEMTRLIANRPVTITINQNYREGMSTSVVAGLNIVSDNAQGIMLVLADQPLVDSQTINLLLDTFATHDKGIIIPVYQGERGHPVIFANRYKGELLRLKGDVGGREVIDQHPDDILEVDVDCRGVCVGIDTVECYHLERSKLKEVV